MRGVWLTSLLVLLGGCAVPPAVQVASLVADGISYVATGKSVTDHGISMVAQKDCAMLRAVKGEVICRAEGQDSTAMAFAPAGEEVDLADDATVDADGLAEDGLPLVRADRSHGYGVRAEQPTSQLSPTIPSPRP